MDRCHRRKQNAKEHTSVYWMFDDDVLKLLSVLGLSGHVRAASIDIFDNVREDGECWRDWRAGDVLAILCSDGGVHRQSSHWTVALNAFSPVIAEACHRLSLGPDECPQESGIAGNAFHELLDGRVSVPRIRSGGDCGPHALLVAYSVLAEAGVVQGDTHRLLRPVLDLLGMSRLSDDVLRPETAVRGSSFPMSSGDSALQISGDESDGACAERRHFAHGRQGDDSVSGVGPSILAQSLFALNISSLAVPVDEAAEALRKPSVYKRPAGRPSGEAGLSYSVKAEWAVEVGYHAQEDFRLALKSWASKTSSGKVLDIHVQGLPVQRSIWRYRFWCGSCHKCITRQYRPTGDGWCGYASYDLEGRRVSVTHTPNAQHGQFDRRTGGALLSSTAKAQVQQALKGGTSKLQLLLEVARKEQSTPPNENKLQSWVYRQKEALKTACDDPSGALGWSKHEWGVCDWERLLRQYPRFDTLDNPTSCPICVVDICLDSKNTAVVFCRPALVSETFKLLVNKRYIKLCGDGTFRMMREDWQLLSLGVLSKHYSVGDEKMAATRTALNGFLFALTNKECRKSYSLLFKSAKTVVQRLNGIDLKTCVRQYHADWHQGEEAARKLEFPHSLRCGDWAHFIGATRPKTSSRSATHTDPRIVAWRAGVYETVRKSVPTQERKKTVGEFLKTRSRRVEFSQHSRCFIRSGIAPSRKWREWASRRQCRH